MLLVLGVSAYSCLSKTSAARSFVFLVNVFVAVERVS